MNLVPVLVLNWNGWEDTLECVDHIKTLNTGPIWVIDNGSYEDRSAELGACVRFVPLGFNYGWAGGYNRAIKTAAAEGINWAYLLNNDARPTAGFLEACVCRAGEHVACVGSRSIRPNGTVHFDGTYPDSVRPSSVAEGEQVVPYVDGAGMLVSLHAMAVCGGFDERYFCYREEHEWCRRVSLAGWTVKVALDSTVVHTGAASDCNANRAYYMNRNAFLDSHQPHANENISDTFTRSYRLYRAANQARQHGDPILARALAEALVDGLAGRVGARPSRTSRVAWWLARTWPLPAELRSKIADGMHRG